MEKIEFTLRYKEKDHHYTLKWDPKDQTDLEKAAQVVGAIGPEVVKIMKR